MQVGLLPSAPWVAGQGEPPEGVEVDLVRGLANALKAKIVWVGVDEADVLEALERHELDLVVGGLTADNPWKAHVAFTRPYYEEDVVIAAPEGAAVTDPEGAPVAVPPGSVDAALVEEQGGTPTPKPADTELEAKPRWRLADAEHAVAVLRTERHVFAVPKGENAWIIAVDRFLGGRQETVRHALEAAR